MASARRHPAPGRAIRGSAIGALAIGLLLGACSEPSPTQRPSIPASTASSIRASGSVLPTGLAHNLDNLASYQFTETIATSATSASAAPSGGGPLVISGTVVNKPVKSLWMSVYPAQFIVIGDEAWSSYDGATWTVSDAQNPLLVDLPPGHEYPTWFDAKASYLRVAGLEIKNGVSCLHYRGDPALESLYSGGASGTFQADVWIAVYGEYPVSGLFGYAASTASGAVTWGFRFDITHIDESANAVAAPTNIVPLPSWLPS